MREKLDLAILYSFHLIFTHSYTTYKHVLTKYTNFLLSHFKAHGEYLIFLFFSFPLLSVEGDVKHERSVGGSYSS